ncbi:MAG: hypothetical protein ACRC17_11085, partial [Culicoidibacterales bacterium]
MAFIINDNWKSIFIEIYNSLYMVTKVLIIVSVCSELAKIHVNKKQDVKYMGNSISPYIVGFIGLISAIAFSSILTIESVEGTFSSVIIAANWTLVSTVVSIAFSELYIKIYYYMLDNRKNLINSYER